MADARSLPVDCGAPAATVTDKMKRYEQFADQIAGG